jgi:tetratricopeptide (TPR) repeat protein
MNFMGNFAKLVFLLLFGFGLHPAMAADEESYITKGNAEYAAGKYQAAAEQYLKVTSSGFQSSALYYNLGNCYFKLGDMPRSILWYERARKLDPGNEDVNFNLNVANSRITDKIEPLPEFFLKRWIWSLIFLQSADNWAVTGIAILIASLILLSLYIASRVLVLRKAGFWGGISALIFALIFLSFAWAGHHSFLSDQAAIILTPTLTVKSSPDEKSTDIFVIHEGCKVVLQDRIGEWFEIRIASGSVGWVKQSDFEKI